MKLSRRAFSPEEKYSEAGLLERDQLIDEIPLAEISVGNKKE
jgi:hypothetical protein